MDYKIWHLFHFIFFSRWIMLLTFLPRLASMCHQRKLEREAAQMPPVLLTLLILQIPHQTELLCPRYLDWLDSRFHLRYLEWLESGFRLTYLDRLKSGFRLRYSGWLESGFRLRYLERLKWVTQLFESCETLKDFMKIVWIEVQRFVSNFLWFFAHQTISFLLVGSGIKISSIQRLYHHTPSAFGQYILLESKDMQQDPVVPVF